MPQALLKYKILVESVQFMEGTPIATIYLEEQVAEYIQNGWIPIGGVSVATIVSGRDGFSVYYVFAQAMGLYVDGVQIRETLRRIQVDVEGTPQAG
jgi:hypothetical protein